MRKVLNFGGEVFWSIVWIFFILAVGFFILHLVQAHVGGVVGNVASGIESAVSPQG
jgi:hypothetical protein